MEPGNISYTELISELQQLQRDYNSLKILYDRAIKETSFRPASPEPHDTPIPDGRNGVSDMIENMLAIKDETIRENESRLQLAIDAVDMAWWNMEVETGAVIFHRRKAEMLGFPPERFKHYRDFTDLVHPDDHESAMEAMRRHFRQEVPTYDTEYRIMTSSGVYRWFYDIGAVVKRSPSGAPLKIIGFVIDITRQKQIETEIRDKNNELRSLLAEKDKFYSIIAHDLRSPLGSFLQILELIEDETMNLTESEKKDLLQRMSSSARNSFRLLENLLQWTQMQRGQMKFQPKEVHLLTLVSEVVSLLDEPARLKTIRLINLIPDIKVYGDPNMLQTIIRNLVSNAIKFTSKNGIIAISAVVSSTQGTIISVRDTGIGMDDEMVNKLFRLDVDTKRPGTSREQGTGLGLILCKDLIEKHGGTIWVESMEGKGSVFNFNIPVRPDLHHDIRE